jgi:hypothetical protein
MPRSARHFFFLCVGALLFLVPARLGRSAGVTIITHGNTGNANGWVTGMENAIPNYPRLGSTNFTKYKVYLLQTGGSYSFTWSGTPGQSPSTTDTGEIVIALDWSQIADGNSSNTYQVASLLVPKLLSTNFISELNGHALAEFPLHLIGHSRGGSLVSELSYQLGTNGVWVDHVTTLDPHPLNNDGFTDFNVYSAKDASAKTTYVNVLFADNYYQTINFFVQGEAVSGAYVRRFTSLSGGYSGTSAEHSNVHLWYHGSINWAVDAYDGEAYINATQRQNWWNAFEQRGTNAGILYSLLGGADRLSTNRPAGGSTSMIKDGFNKQWDLGAGVAANRSALSNNSGAWPNLIRVNPASTNSATQGQSIGMNFYYQWARPVSSNATLQVYLDNDFNALNNNSLLLAQTNLAGTTSTGVVFVTLSVPISAAATPGWHSLYAVISGGGTSRLLYAPELVQVLPAQPPTLDISASPSLSVGVNGIAGQTIILQGSSNLVQWLPLATNTLSSNRWVYPVAPAGSRFYRAVIAP